MDCSDSITTERLDSGLRKILDETAKFPRYTEDLMPIFKSTGTAFWAIIKNANDATRETQE